MLCNLSLNEGKHFVGLPVLNSRIWCRHVKTKNCLPLSIVTPLKTLSAFQLKVDFLKAALEHSTQLEGD